MTYPFHHDLCELNRLPNDQNFGPSKSIGNGKSKSKPPNGCRSCSTSGLSTITTEGSKFCEPKFGIFGCSPIGPKFNGGKCELKSNLSLNQSRDKSALRLISSPILLHLIVLKQIQN